MLTDYFDLHERTSAFPGLAPSPLPKININPMDHVQEVFQQNADQLRHRIPTRFAAAASDGTFVTGEDIGIVFSQVSQHPANVYVVLDLADQPGGNANGQ